MSGPTEQEKAEAKERMRTALNVLERYTGPDGKINATELTKDAVRFQWCLPILCADDDGDRRTMLIAHYLMLGLNGREAIDSAMLADKRI